MDKPQTRGAPQGNYHCMNQPVQRRVRRGQSLIHQGGVVEIIRIVFTTVPRHPRTFGASPIQFPDPRSLTTPELLNTQVFNVLTLEPHEIHLPGHRSPQNRVAHGLGLRLQQTRGPRRRNTVSVVTHTVLPHPHSGGAALRQDGHGTMSDTHPRPDHQDGQRGRWDMGHTSGVGHGDRVGVPMHRAPFHVQEGEAVPDPNQVFRSRRPRSRYVPHGRANVNRPAP